MPVERYYLKDSLTEKTEVLLQGTELHHLYRVMRGKIGDSIELVNGAGCLAIGTVVELDQKKAKIFIKECKTSSLITKVILAQALVKPNKLDFILEKGTELGVDEFWLFPAEHSIKSELSSNQMERAQALTIAAMKQCGRLTLPKITLVPPLSKWEKFSPYSFYGDLNPAAPLFLDSLQKQTSCPSITFFIGPESGWSNNEKKILNEKGVMAVKLHRYILRTETAPLVALSLIHYFFTYKNG